MNILKKSVIVMLIILVLSYLTGCGSRINNLKNENSEVNQNPPTLTMSPTSIPTSITTPTPTPTPSPTPTPTNPFGEVPIEGYEINEKFENINMLSLPEDFDEEAYYDYLRYKYGWNQDDYFYRHPDQFFEGTDEQFGEYWYRANSIENVLTAMETQLKDKYGNPLYYNDPVVMKTEDGFCNYAYGYISEENLNSVNLDQIYVSWYYWVEIIDGTPKYLYSMNDVDTLRETYTKENGSTAKLDYLMDQLAYIYNADMQAQLNGTEYESNDFIKRDIFCIPVEDGWYDVSDLEYAAIYHLK